MSEEEGLSAMERAELAQALSGLGTSVPDGKQNVHTFLHNVATAEDTTKLGNLSDEEIGKLNYPIRTFKSLGLFARQIMGKESLAKFFEAQSEIGTSTSLSKDGFLVKLAVVQRKEFGDVTTKPKKANKSWFKRKDSSENNEGEST